MFMVYRGRKSNASCSHIGDAPASPACGVRHTRPTAPCLKMIAPMRDIGYGRGGRMQCDFPARERSEEESQASLTVSALKSLPSVSNTFLTMLFASRPARAYIAAG